MIRLDLEIVDQKSTPCVKCDSVRIWRFCQNACITLEPPFKILIRFDGRIDDVLTTLQPSLIPDFSHHVHIFLLSTSGVIYKPADTLCSILGIPPSEITDVLRS
jgi:hypothetical protein